MQSLELEDAILQQLNKTQTGSDDSKVRIDQMANRHRGFGSTIVEHLAYRRDPVESAALEKVVRGALLDAVYDPSIRPLNINDGEFSITDARAFELHNELLDALQYDGMENRAGAVAEAHESTFQWIFDDEVEQERPWANLRGWLESDHQLYWITGKAGSGKSTLMKFISQPPVPREPNGPAEARCIQYLQRWSDGQPLTVASFYLWAAGTKLQTSKPGLYRTLLHQLLMKHPDFIERVFPERWEALCLFNEDPKAFTDDELQDCLMRVVLLLAGTSTKLCLFIDGLDKFDGDHGDLIKLLTRILDGSSVELCVASRPWVVFEEALKNKPSLRLEDLTFNDIKKYVTMRFHHDENFSRLWGREFEFADSLIETVVRKAAGVFLWVSLVVSSLLDGMKFGDRVSDLQRRLDSLPPDLEDLYSRILENLDPFYFEHAEQYFSLMTACQEPPSAVLFSLADEEKPEFSLQLQNTRWSSQDLDARIDVIQRRLNSRCKGLIEVGRGARSPPDHTTLRRHLLHHPTVQYLHKTVKDYIEKPDVQGRLFQGLKSPFDPHLRLCSANFAMFWVESSFEDVNLLDRVDSHYGQIAHAMRHAARVSPQNVPIMVQVLDQLEKNIRYSRLRSLSIHYGPLSRSIMDCLFPSLVRGYRQELTPVETLESYGDSFLSATVKCGVLKYVEARVGSPLIRDVRPQVKLVAPYKSFSGRSVRSPWRRLTEPWVRLDFKSLLAGSVKVSPLDTLLSDAVPVLRPNFDLVSLLLEKGANTNATILENTSAKSLWSRTLAAVICSFAYGTLEQEQKLVWLRIVSLMLTHGARTSRNDIKCAFDAVQDYFEVSGSLTVEEGTELLRSNLRLHRRGKAELQLDFLSGLMLSKRRAE